MGKHITTTIIAFDEAGNQISRPQGGDYFGVYFRVGNDWYFDDVYRSRSEAKAAQRRVRQVQVRPPLL